MAKSKNAALPPESSFGSAVRRAMSSSPAFAQLARTLGVDPDRLALSCAQQNLLVVDSSVVEPLATLLTHRDLAGGEAWPMGDERPTGGADMVDFAVELHGETVSAVKAAGVDMSVFVIQARDKDGVVEFWSNDDGWVESPQESTLFYGYEVAARRLPRRSGDSPAEWKPFAAAVEEHEDSDDDQDSATSERG